MADFAVFGEAVARACGDPPGSFLARVLAARTDAMADAVDASPVGRAVLAFVAAQPGGRFRGTATDLLDRLTAAGGRADARGDWPASPKGLSDRLRKVAVGLRAVGVAVGFAREGKGRERIITLEPVVAVPVGLASAASAVAVTTGPDNRFRADAGGDGVASAVRPPAPVASAGGGRTADAAARGGRTAAGPCVRHMDHARQRVAPPADAADAGPAAPTEGEADARG